jgi:hypothetical protein
MNTWLMEDDKESSSMFKALNFASVMVLATVASAQAGTIGYWQYQGAAAGASATTVVSQVNSPARDGVGAADGNVAPVYSSQVVAPMIQAGVGGPIVNASNTGSLEFLNAMTSNPHLGGVVRVSGADPVMQPRNFTIEAFVKVDAVIPFAGIVGMERDGGTSWQMDMTDTGKLRVRYDVHAIGVPTNTNPGPTGYNHGFSTNVSLNDGQWHHIALTYNDATQMMDVYADYVRVAGGVTFAPIVYNASLLEVGHVAGRAFDGWVDEVRFSDTVLGTNDFLRAVAIPEPASLLVLLGAAATARRRARKV